MNLLFNNRDRQLLAYFPRGTGTGRSNREGTLFNYHLHPRGIKELVNPKGIRVANLMRNLLDTLEKGLADDRLRALHALRDEVYYSSQGSMPRNTARALLAVMKEFLREDKDEQRRLELAYTFHDLLTGKPGVVRKVLKEYHLLEMPEEWNQLAFDHHVHDANTKGRKSPTHLIMDGWIKGIRKLTVIYYDFIPPEAARELLTAASYMGIEVRIGVELMAELRSKPVHLIWTPRGFSDTQDFLRFLERGEVHEFMQKGRERSRLRENRVFQSFARFSTRQKGRFNETMGITLPEFREEDFRSFVGAGQASLLHLAEFIHTLALPLLKARVKTCTAALAAGTDEEEKTRLLACMEQADRCTSEYIFDTFLKEGDGSETGTSPDSPGHSPRPTPRDLIRQLENLHPGYRVTLNLTALKAREVLDIIHQCEGRINALEIYNHKDWARGLEREIPRIRSFQHPLNEGNTIALKRAIMSLISEAEEEDSPEATEWSARLFEILKDLPNLIRFYESNPLKDSWGSDSTGRSNQLYGMGLAVVETLPKKTQKALRKSEKNRLLPVCIRTKLRITFSSARFWSLLLGLSRKSDGMEARDRSGIPEGREWVAQEYSRDAKNLNNVVALGWHPPILDNGLLKGEEEPVRKGFRYSWKYLNSNMKNLLKILVGFIPAFLTFALTKDWWVLAYLGAPIWFSITGLRNILQSIIGGDSLRRSPLLTWNSYINWSRVSDSLLFTGFSVPLLDFLVKQLLLNEGLGINTSTNVVALYAIMALVNGIYISSHNYFRGLPLSAITGNFFRSILSIPLAIFFNFLLRNLLLSHGVEGADMALQKWAAVVSKAASDTVAGIIEGTSDRGRYIRARKMDYKRKLDQMYSTFAKMELLLPQTDVLRLLQDPKELINTIQIEDPELLNSTIHDVLDLLYFWFYQPHARTVLKRQVRRMTPEERLIFLRFQHVLRRYKMISSLFLDGLLGKNFSKALGFYLSHNESYRQAMNRLLGTPSH